MRIEVDLTPEDNRAFSRFVMYGGNVSRYGMPGGWLRYAAVLFVVGLVFGFVRPFFSRSTAWSLHLPTALMLLGIFVSIFVFLLLRRRKAQADVSPTGRYTYTISAAGLHEQSANTELMMRWSGVRDIHDGSEHIFVLGPGIGAILPKRCLGAPGPELVFSTLQQNWRSAGGQ